MNHIATLSDHFSATGYVEFEALKSEWEHFKLIAQDLKLEGPMTEAQQPEVTSTEWLLTNLCSIPSFIGMFTNLVKLAAGAQSQPVTNAWPERGVSTLKRIKTRLRNSLKDDMLECLLRISINSPPESTDVVSNALGLWLQEKNRRKLPPVMATATMSTGTSEGEELQETIITLTKEVNFLNEEVQDFEDEIY